MYQDMQARVRRPVVNARIYYDDDGVLVTDQILAIDGREYQIAELRFPRTVLGPRGRFLGVAVLNRTRSRSLWCEYRGRTIRILWTNDRTRHGQICRAITRARENRARPPSAG